MIKTTSRRRPFDALRRAALALALTVASIGATLGVASAPAQANSTWWCGNSPVPPGYVVTYVALNSTNCGYYNLYYITNELHPDMSICAVTPVPPGWRTVYAGWGYANCPGYYLYVITPL